MKFVIVFLLALLLVVKADIFVRLGNVPTFETNTTKLCDIVLEIESPSTDRASFCNDASNYEIYTVWYRMTGVKFKNVTGRGFRIAPTEIIANLTHAEFFEDPSGTVVVVLNFWKNDTLVIIVLSLFLIFFTILSLWVAAATRKTQ
jgi:hypothetical protein